MENSLGVAIRVWVVLIIGIILYSAIRQPKDKRNNKWVKNNKFKHYPIIN